MSRRLLVATAVVLALAGLAAPIGLAPAARAAEGEFTMATAARYTVRPVEREVGVAVEVTFTNTTPDPEGKFSVFEEVKLAVQDAASEASAKDAAGDLEVAVAREDDINGATVNVATVKLREPVRFEKTATFTLSYLLPDGGEAGLRVRPSAVVFPVWSFGTAGEVTVELPATYEVRADGDTLSAERGEEATLLTSGAIADPTRWLALVSATRPTSYTTVSERVALSGGTADLQVRAWSDDAEWGDRTLALLARALPLLEEAIGLPYQQIGPLVVTEAVATDPAAFGEGSGASQEIQVAFDQPAFTALHQLAHVWAGSQLVSDRWIREGLASHYAAVVAPELDVEAPYDPATRAGELAAAAFRLGEWQDAESAVERERYGYAASWALIDEIAATVENATLSRVLLRTAAGVDAYEPPAAEPPIPSGLSVTALGSRRFLDHLETVSGASLGPLFAERVLGEADVALLAPRGEARAAYAEMLTAAGDWGAPDPIRTAMGEWRFDDAMAGIEEARAWLAGRNALLADVETAGLSAPERLRAVYRTDGGGQAARTELQAEQAVVSAYRDTLADANREHNLVERIGLVGATAPGVLLARANPLFAEGDLSGATDAIGEAQRLLSGAQVAGLVRITSAVAIVLALLALAWYLTRDRRRRPAPLAD